MASEFCRMIYGFLVDHEDKNEMMSSSKIARDEQKNERKKTVICDRYVDNEFSPISDNFVFFSVSENIMVVSNKGDDVLERCIRVLRHRGRFDSELNILVFCEGTRVPVSGLLLYLQSAKHY